MQRSAGHLTPRRGRQRRSHPRPQERTLFVRFQKGDYGARDELVARFLPLARHVAGRYRNGNEPFDDLVQVATVGLIKAIDRFDPSYGTAFTSFAVPCIAGELKRHFRDVAWAVRVPRSVQELALQVEGAMDRLQRRLGRAPTPGEVADVLGEDVEKVLDAMAAATAYDALSLDAPLTRKDDDAFDYASTVGEDDGGYELIDARATIDSAMHALSEREQTILRLRFEEDRTQAEIASVIGMSQMHVSRLLRGALARLRAVAEDRSGAS